MATRILFWLGFALAVPGLLVVCIAHGLEDARALRKLDRRAG